VWRDSRSECKSPDGPGCRIVHIIYMHHTQQPSSVCGLGCYVPAQGSSHPSSSHFRFPIINLPIALALALESHPCPPLIPSLLPCVSCASQTTGLDVCHLCVCWLARPNRFAAVVKSQVRRRQTRTHWTPPARVPACSRHHGPTPQSLVFEPRRSDFLPFATPADTTLDSGFPTLDPPAALGTADRCEREVSEVPATTGLLGPSAWKGTGDPGGGSASRVNRHTVEGGG
jgi:hypothetical protein